MSGLSLTEGDLEALAKKSRKMIHDSSFLFTLARFVGSNSLCSVAVAEPLTMRLGIIDDISTHCLN